MREINAILALAYRDFIKLLRDPMRMASTFIFPLVFIGILGGSLQANLGKGLGFNFLAFTFTGVLAQTLFQTTAFGIISLIEDRENDFSQEIFVSPISRYSIIFGKILGETLVALPQGIAIVLFAFVIGVPITLFNVLGLAAAGLVICLIGGAFGVLILANLKSQRAANQIFPFIILPQYFLAGIFAPINVLPFYLDIISRISPLRYAVDFVRSIFYIGNVDYPKAVLADMTTNGIIIAGMFAAFLFIGTFLFVRGERNR